ncbi:hypothetical protein [Plantactinospora sp. GCM10030261]|uniref:hypothetical protein n=1 Tax=Plantactinospora sp. GCM10030261 TaxID=3273420 RepID=UPI00361FB0DA
MTRSGGSPSTPEKLGWSGTVRMPDLWDPLTSPDTAVTFSKLVRARHHRSDPDLRAEAEAARVALWREFVAQHGRVVDSFYCGNLVGGCAMTEQITHAGRRTAVTRTLHPVLNSSVPEFTALEATCNELVADANAGLGRSQSRELAVVTDGVFSAMTRVLRAADEWAATPPKDEQYLADRLRAATEEVAQAKRRVRAAVRREASFIYLQGVLGGAVLTLLLCVLLGVANTRYWPTTVDPGPFVGALVFGLLGAVTSVFQRISGDEVVLTFTPSRLRMLALGALRPVVGATFGAVAHFGLVGGVLGATASSAGVTAAVGLSAIAGFAAGFSERFATDVVRRTNPPPNGTP